MSRRQWSAVFWLQLFLTVQNVYTQDINSRQCADEECKEVISFGRTVARYKPISEDRLGFEQGTEVAIYSKEYQGRRDLWYGKIGEKFGIISKTYVKEFKVRHHKLKHTVPIKLEDEKQVFDGDAVVENRAPPDPTEAASDPTEAAPDPTESPEEDEDVASPDQGETAPEHTDTDSPESDGSRSPPDSTEAVLDPTGSPEEDEDRASTVQSDTAPSRSKILESDKDRAPPIPSRAAPDPTESQVEDDQGDATPSHTKIPESDEGGEPPSPSEENRSGLSKTNDETPTEAEEQQKSNEKVVVEDDLKTIAVPPASPQTGADEHASKEPPLPERTDPTESDDPTEVDEEDDGDEEDTEDDDSEDQEKDEKADDDAHLETESREAFLRRKQEIEKLQAEPDHDDDSAAEMNEFISRNQGSPQSPTSSPPSTMEKAHISSPTDREPKPESSSEKPPVQPDLESAQPVESISDEVAANEIEAGASSETSSSSAKEDEALSGAVPSPTDEPTKEPPIPIVDSQVKTSPEESVPSASAPHTSDSAEELKGASKEEEKDEDDPTEAGDDDKSDDESKDLDGSSDEDAATSESQTGSDEGDLDLPSGKEPSPADHPPLDGQPAVKAEQTPIVHHAETDAKTGGDYVDDVAMETSKTASFTSEETEKGLHGVRNEEAVPDKSDGVATTSLSDIVTTSAAVYQTTDVKDLLMSSETEFYKGSSKEVSELPPVETMTDADNKILIEPNKVLDIVASTAETSIVDDSEYSDSKDTPLPTVSVAPSVLDEGLRNKSATLVQPSSSVLPYGAPHVARTPPSEVVAAGSSVNEADLVKTEPTLTSTATSDSSSRNGTGGDAVPGQDLYERGKEYLGRKMLSTDSEDMSSSAATPVLEGTVRDKRMMKLSEDDIDTETLVELKTWHSSGGDNSVTVGKRDVDESVGKESEESVSADTKQSISDEQTSDATEIEDSTDNPKESRSDDSEQKVISSDESQEITGKNDVDESGGKEEDVSKQPPDATDLEDSSDDPKDSPSGGNEQTVTPSSDESPEIRTPPTDDRPETDKYSSVIETDNGKSDVDESGGKDLDLSADTKQSVSDKQPLDPTEVEDSIDNSNETPSGGSEQTLTPSDESPEIPKSPTDGGGDAYSTDFSSRKINDEDLEVDDVTETGTVSKGFGKIEKILNDLGKMLPPSVKMILEQEPLGLPPALIVLVALFSVALFISYTLCYFVCDRNRNRKRKSVEFNFMELDQKCKLLEIQKESLEEQAEEATRKLLELEKSQKSQKETSFREKQEIQTVHLHNSSLQEQVAALQQQLTEAQSRLTEFHEWAETKEASVLQLDQHAQMLEQAKTSLDAKLLTLQTALGEAEANLAQKEEDVKTKEEEIKKLAQSKKQLQGDVKSWKTGAKEAKSQLSDLQQQYNELEERFKLKENELEVLRDCFHQLDLGGSKGDDETEEEAAQRREQTMSVMMDVSRTNSTLKTLEEDKEQFEKRLKEEIKLRENLEEKNQEHIVTVRSLEDAKLTAEREAREAKSELKTLSDYFRQRETDLQMQLGEHVVLKKQTGNAVQSAEEKAQKREQEMLVYKQQVTDMKKEIEKLDDTYRKRSVEQEQRSHDAWLAARDAQRKLEEAKNEATTLRKRLTELERTKALSQSNEELLRPQAQHPFAHMPNSPLNLPPGAIPPGAIPPGAIPPPPGAIPPGTLPPSFLPPSGVSSPGGFTNANGPVRPHAPNDRPGSRTSGAAPSPGLGNRDTVTSPPNAWMPPPPMMMMRSPFMHPPPPPPPPPPMFVEGRTPPSGRSRDRSWSPEADRPYRGRRSPRGSDHYRPYSRSPSPGRQRYSRSPSPRYSRSPSPRYSRSPSPRNSRSPSPRDKRAALRRPPPRY